MIRKAFLSCFFINLLITHYAQDIHWSQFNAIPLFQNPGNAGHFNGDFRFVANYRNQWKSVSVPFSTLSLAADSRAHFHKNLGYGLFLFHDASGDGKLKTIEIQANTSYLIKLAGDSSHTIRPGVTLGMNHRQVNWDNFYFDNQYNGVTFDPSLPTNEPYQTDRRTNFSIGIGAIYDYSRLKRETFSAGLGLFNLNRPNQGFYGTKTPRDIRLNVVLKACHKLDIDWDLLPSLNLSFQGKYREFILGSSAKYTLVERLGNYRAFYGGLWLRNKDAAIVTLGLDYQSWFFGISYDINYSKLVPASNARGGIEFAVRHILHQFKPSKSLHRVCPDFI
jgi:type IX secretion system PorP/SprF family membrane protein